MKFLPSVRVSLILTAVALCGGSPQADAQSTTILREDFDAVTPLPPNSQASKLFQKGNFIGLGTNNPNGPLEVTDQSIAPSSESNVANIIITGSNYSGGTPPPCLGTSGSPPAEKCTPDYAFVLRYPIYSMMGALTGYSVPFRLDRGGSIGIGREVYSSAGTTKASGFTMRDRCIDLERNTTTGPYVPVSIRFRSASSATAVGTIDHTIGTNASNELEIAPSLTAPAGTLKWLRVKGSVSASEHLWVDNDGYIQGKLAVGNVPIIGDYKLFVGRGILTERVKVTLKSGTDWSDYVFAPDYSLMPLAQVGDYVAQNCHLPDVPSADEVLESGIDLAKMDATLLRKIEELTLYVLQQQKEIEKLKKAIAEKK